MSKLVGKATHHLFAKHMEQYAPKDPMYEEFVNERGKTKRRRRDVPPGLSKRDQKILKSIQRRAHYLDKGFHICGVRFGWTFIIGIIPAAGDVTNVLLNYTLVVRKAKQAEIPPWLLRRMLWNNTVSAGVGFVPLVGDVLLAIWKANSRNAALLEEFLRLRGEELLALEAAGEDPVQAADPSQAVAAQGKASGSTSKGQVAKGVSKADAVQVRPGAGKEPGEKINTSKE